jgi:folate-dependent phosphoribosylglycinamide formyltransferase PurN
VLAVEHQVLAEAVNLFCEGRLSIAGGRVERAG